MYLSPNGQAWKNKKKSLCSPIRVQHDIFPAFTEPTHGMAAIPVLQQMTFLPVCCHSSCTSVTEQWRCVLPDESPVLCSPRGQERPRSSTTASGCTVTLASHESPEHINEGFTTKCSFIQKQLKIAAPPTLSPRHQDQNCICLDAESISCIPVATQGQNYFCEWRT